MKVENTGYSDAKRIMNGETVVGMAIQYATGLWAPHGVDDKKLAAATFKTPTQVRKWFEEKANDRPE